MEGKYDNANRAFKKVVDLNGKLAPAAELYWAKSLLALHRNSEAQQKLEALIEASPPANIKAQAEEELRNFSQDSDDEEGLKERALNFYQNGEFQKVISTLRTFKDRSDPNVSLLEGLALTRLGREKEARQVFERSAHLAVNSETAKNAQSLIDQVTSHAPSENPYWLFIDLATAYDSNIYLDGRSLTQVSSALLNGSFGFGARFFNSGYYSAKLGYLLNWDEVTKTDELRVVTHTINAPISYMSGKSSASLGPFYQQQTWASQPALSKTGIRLKATQTWDSADIGLDAELASQENLSTTYSYIKGPTQHFRIYAGLIGESTYAQLGYEFGSDNIGNLQYTNGLLPLANQYSGPSARVVWKSSPDWVLSLCGSYLTRKYGTSSQPGSKTRKDQELSESFRASYILNPQMNIYGVIDQLNSSSTLGSSDIADKNINDTRGLIGFSWEVL